MYFFNTTSFASSSVVNPESCWIKIDFCMLLVEKFFPFDILIILNYQIFKSFSFVVELPSIQRGGRGEGGGRCLQGNLWYSPPASMTSSGLATVTFKMASKVFIEETDKNFDFITEIPLRFLGFGDFKISIVIEN